MVSLFTRGYCDRQPISRRGQRTGSVRIVSARRIVGLVEVELDRAIGGRFGIEEARSRVRRGLAGQVAKNDEQAMGVFILFRIQTVGFATELELNIACQVGRVLIAIDNVNPD